MNDPVRAFGSEFLSDLEEAAYGCACNDADPVHSGSDSFLYEGIRRKQEELRTATAW